MKTNTLLRVSAALCSVWLIVGCSKENQTNIDEKPMAEGDTLDEALKCLDEFIMQLKQADTKSGGIKKSYDRSAVYSMAKPVSRTKNSQTDEPILYVVNFEGNGGYAVISSSSQFGPHVVCLTESGNLGKSVMERAESRIRNPYEYVHPRKISDPDDSLFVPSLILTGGDDPLANAYAPIDDGPGGGGGPSGIYGPYLMTKWKQTDAPFDSLTINNWPAGCVAVAVAQIMAFEEYASNMTFNGVTCSWSEMKTVRTYPNLFNADSLGTTLGRSQVANYLLALGDANNCGIQYGPAESSSDAVGARRAFLNNGYSNAQIHFSVSFSHNLRSIVRNQLFSGHPVYCDGSSSLTSGHAWVIDGYFAGYYHINWGWGGASDGYYSAGVFDTTQRNSIDLCDPGTVASEARNYTFGYSVITY